MIYLLTVLILAAAVYIAWSFLKMKRISDQNYQLRAVVENQEDFTFLVNRDFEVKATNLTYRVNTDDGEPNVLGNVLHCKNAYHVGRCGESESCGSCPLRFVITKSFERGTGFSGVNACMEVYDQNDKVVDIDVQVEGHFVNVGHQGHMVINVKDETKQQHGNLPKILFITENMVLFDRMRNELSNEFRVLGADNEHQAFHRLQLAEEYKFLAVLTDTVFYEKNKDVLKLMAGNNQLPLYVLSSSELPATCEGIYFVNDQIGGKELTKLILTH